MIVKIKDKEYSFEGYFVPINMVQKIAENCYQKGRADAINDTLNMVAGMLIDYLASDGGYVFDLDKIREQLKEQK